MAYDKIRVIHTRLDNSIRYVMNAEKTIDGSTGTVLISGINCFPNTAYRDMMQTKRRWDKANRRIQGYHVIHSFAPGEVTPEKAQEIGMELARRLVGDRFEAVVSTHTDHDHVHCHMEMMLTMIEYAGAKEDDDDFQSALDLLFEALEEEQPDHIAVRQYHIFKQAAGKTAKSILVSAAVRLASFTLPEIQDITGADSLELSKLGDRKQAIFCVIPDSNDVSLNFLVGMLYTQAFQELYYQADKVHMGGLPVPVRLMFDEFANVALPDGYARLQATMRSRNIMATIILQNISQLKALFKDDWEGIIGNADTMIFMFSKFLC